MTTFAYLRTSTDRNQTTDNQRKTITDFGITVDEWFADDGMSGGVNALDRPVFKAMMDKAQAGDTLCTVAIDRLGRSAVDILNTIETFRVRGIRLRCMALDGIDLTSTTGKILTMLLALLAEVEKDNCRIRTLAGLARTKAQGTVLGRPLRIPAPTLEVICKEREKGVGLDTLSNRYGYDRSTISQVVKKWKNDLPAYNARWSKQLSQASVKAEMV